MKKIDGPKRLKGYKMYTFSEQGGYPLCCEGDDDDSIVVEMYEFFDDNIMRDVDGMESGAGYYRKTIDIDGDEYIIYLHTRKRLEDNGYFLIKNGDFRSFIDNINVRQL
jgi:gamma-glutamylcyclotransferase (GGCT)/AIG2-like uncharacterized protein YtfP